MCLLNVNIRSKFELYSTSPNHKYLNINLQNDILKLLNKFLFMTTSPTGRKSSPMLIQITNLRNQRVEYGMQ